MNHPNNVVFFSFLTFCEVMVCPEGAEAVQVNAMEEIYRTVVTTQSSEVTITSKYHHQELKQNEPIISPPRNDTKFELGATNITRHHSFEYFNRSKPQFHLSNPRFTGPFFEEGTEVINVTARVGSTINLDCRIGLLGDKTVTWMQKRNHNINLLTVGRLTHSKDERIHLAFKYPNNYRLQISYVTKRDDGIYECQVATHPPKFKQIFLKITAPDVKIVDESIREVHERYYRQGSSLLLTCLATSIGFSKDDPKEQKIITWRHGDTILSKNSRLNMTKEKDLAISTLTITPLERRHSGNYTCSVGNIAETAVAVHVLNGELPAAVQTAGVQVKSSNIIFTFLIVSLWIVMR